LHAPANPTLSTTEKKRLQAAPNSDSI
jgi:hypothetical protein